MKPKISTTPQETRQPSPLWELITKYRNLPSSSAEEKERIAHEMIPHAHRLAYTILRNNLRVYNYAIATEYAEEASWQFVEDVMKDVLEKEEEKMTYHILHICYRVARITSRNISTAEFQFEDEYSVESHIDEQMQFKEWISALKQLPLRVQALLAFGLTYPEEPLSRKRIRFDNRLDCKLATILVRQGERFMQSTKVVKANRNPLPTTRLLFLEELYHTNPKLLLFLLLIKDNDTIFRLIELLGGKTISIPRMQDVRNAWDNVETTPSSFNKRQSLLAILSKTSTIDLSKVNTSQVEQAQRDTATSFFRKEFRAAAKRHQEVEERLLASVRKEKDPVKIASVYQTMSKSMSQMMAYVQNSGGAKQRKLRQRTVTTPLLKKRTVTVRPVLKQRAVNP